MHGKLSAALLLIVTGGGVPTWPQTTSAQSTTPPAPRQDCRGPEHRQFDFWLGTWDVVANGKTAGRNRIEADLDGCAILESYEATGGYRGRSVNFYDRVTKSWYQAWIDYQGGALLLRGAFRDGKMVMESEPLPMTPQGGGIQRITWTPAADGLRQHWEASADGGKTWTSVFDGRYVKVK
jgi:hypothetical protein